MKIPVILGPTASGKSDLAFQLAQNIDGEIISCDSRQIYRNMDIGTAKPTKEELTTVPHHLIDILSPSEEYSAAHWALDAEKALLDIISRGKQPIICGGTFFYLQALTHGFDTTVPPNHAFREEALTREKEIGTGTLYKELVKIDPQRAEEIHPHDLYRTVRALQVALKATPIQREITPIKEDEHTFLNIVLHLEREKVYTKINNRVDTMVGLGLFEEFKTLLSQGYGETSPGLKCVGYQEFFNYISEQEHFESALEKIKQHSRKYAKRQLTWLRNKIEASLTLTTNDNSDNIRQIQNLL